MEYNFLLLEDNKLSIKKNKTFLQLTQENIDNLKSAYRAAGLCGGDPSPIPVGSDLGQGQRPGGFPPARLVVRC